MNAELYKNEKSSKFYIHLLIHGVPNFVFVYLFVIFVVVFVIVVVFGGLPLFLCFVLFCFVFLRQGLSVVLEPVLKLALADQADLKLIEFACLSLPSVKHIYMV